MSAWHLFPNLSFRVYSPVIICSDCSQSAGSHPARRGRNEMTEVVVAGGGTAGFAAAIAAARTGATVTLVEQMSYLGGTMTGGLVPGIVSMRHQPWRDEETLVQLEFALFRRPGGARHRPGAGRPADLGGRLVQPAAGRGAGAGAVRPRADEMGRRPDGPRGRRQDPLSDQGHGRPQVRRHGHRHRDRLRQRHSRRCGHRRDRRRACRPFRRRPLRAGREGRPHLRAADHALLPDGRRADREGHRVHQPLGGRLHRRPTSGS